MDLFFYFYTKQGSFLPVLTYTTTKFSESRAHNWKSEKHNDKDGRLFGVETWCPGQSEQSLGEGGAQGTGS